MPGPMSEAYRRRRERQEADLERLRESADKLKRDRQSLNEEMLARLAEEEEADQDAETRNPVLGCLCLGIAFVFGYIFIAWACIPIE